MNRALAILTLLLGTAWADAFWPETGKLLFPDAWAGPTVNPAELSLLQEHELLLDGAFRTLGDSRPFTTWGNLRVYYRAPRFSIGAGTGLDYYRAELYGAYAFEPFGVAFHARRARANEGVVWASEENHRYGMELGLGIGWAGPREHRAWLWWFAGPQPQRYRIRMGYRLPLGRAFALIETTDEFKRGGGRFDLSLSYGWEPAGAHLQQRYAFTLNPGMDSSGFGFHLSGNFQVLAPLWRPELRVLVSGGAGTRAWIRYKASRDPAGVQVGLHKLRWRNTLEAEFGNTLMRFDVPYLDLGVFTDDVRLNWGARLEARIRWP